MWVCVCVVLLLHLTVNISGMFLLVRQGPRARELGLGQAVPGCGRQAATGKIATGCRMGVSESASNLRPLDDFK